MNRSELSILIPTYNDCCVDLVKALACQAANIPKLHYEIIVVDDGSTRPETKLQATEINALDNCRFISRNINVGRAKIRNILTVMARHHWLLFLDSDMKITSDDFILQYLQADRQAMVIYGGNCVQRPMKPADGTLKYRYEAEAEDSHSAAERNKSPYQQFNTSNFLVAKSVMEAHPFDDRIQTYGYEDVMFGKSLEAAGINIYHIDNPVGFQQFESNVSFLAKTEEAMYTLNLYHEELKGYSKVLDAYHKLRLLGLAPLLRWLFHAAQTKMKTNLLGTHPSLFIYKCYKLGFYSTIAHGKHRNKKEIKD